MRSTAHTTKLTRALASVLVAAAVAAPAAGARPIDSGPNIRPVDVPPPPSSIAAGVGMEYGDLRAQGTTAESQPVVAEPSAPAGFDWPSAAIGAAAAAALSLLSFTALAMRRRPASG